jgi:hypothetical protein
MEGNIYPLIDQKNLHRTKGRTGEHCQANYRSGHHPTNGTSQKSEAQKPKENRSSLQRLCSKELSRYGPPP